ncbi:MAG: signal peptidase II [Isosphaeraceae bacterium]
MNGVGAEAGMGVRSGSGRDAALMQTGEAITAAPATRVGLRHWILFWSIALGGLAFDLTTKTMIFARVGEPPAPVVTLVPNVLELQTSYNKGALWGLGRNFQHSSLFFGALSIVAAVAICYWLFGRGAASDWRLSVALALIMAGALGNCYDRLVLGHVRDFMHFHVDPIGFDCAIFNFADNMLIAGAVVLMLLALRPEPTAEPAPPIAVL